MRAPGSCRLHSILSRGRIPTDAGDIPTRYVGEICWLTTFHPPFPLSLLFMSTKCRSVGCECVIVQAGFLGLCAERNEPNPARCREYPLCSKFALHFVRPTTEIVQWSPGQPRSDVSCRALVEGRKVTLDPLIFESCRDASSFDMICA